MADEPLYVAEEQVAAANLLLSLHHMLGEEPEPGLWKIANALSEDEVALGIQPLTPEPTLARPLRQGLQPPSLGGGLVS